VEGAWGPGAASDDPHLQGERGLRLSDCDGHGVLAGGQRRSGDNYRLEAGGVGAEPGARQLRIQCHPRGSGHRPGTTTRSRAQRQRIVLSQ